MFTSLFLIRVKIHLLGAFPISVEHLEKPSILRLQFFYTLGQPISGEHRVILAGEHSEPVRSVEVLLNKDIVPTDAAGVLEAHREEKVVHLPPEQVASG